MRHLSRSSRSLLLVLAALAPASCTRALDPSAPAGSAPRGPVLDAPRVDAVPASPAPSASASPAPASPTPAPAAAAPGPGYPWLSAPPAAVLAERVAAPEGFVRVDLAPGTFGAWLRTLPLEPPGTPVRSFSGQVILPANHPSLTAVVALDVGDRDLQQCADSVIRLHAEWLFAQGRLDGSYRAASGAAMPFTRWARGERMVPQGLGFTWSTSARPDASHASYRRWLDAVFTWANTGSLSRDSEPVAEADLHPGDFVVQPGAPGHTVLVLDLARAPDGRRALLLGQGYMPAQSFQVLRAGTGSSWFVVEPGSLALDTPFWAPFPWKTLHRFAGT